jgi:hypothetical protein
MAQYEWRAIAQLFNKSLLKGLAKEAQLEAIIRAANYSPIAPLAKQFTLGQLLDQLHDLLTLHYRSEYVYKNAIAKKIALERHVKNQSRFIPEFRVNQSKADTVILNGTSTVYEIKTELDDLARLSGQLADYKFVFDKIYVVTHPGGVQKVADAIGDDIGIITLDEQAQLAVTREALSNLPNVAPLMIFESLRRAEYLHILHEHFGYTPTPNRFMEYYEAREQFGKLSPIDAHEGMLRCLKARTKDTTFMEFVRNLPQSLRALGLASEFSLKQQNKILEKLSLPV